MTFSASRATINKMHLWSTTMTLFSNDDIEEFAKWLGFDGSDADTFYEAYYDIDYYDDIEAEEPEACWDP